MYRLILFLSLRQDSQSQSEGLKTHDSTTDNFVNRTFATASWLKLVQFQWNGKMSTGCEKQWENGKSNTFHGVGGPNKKGPKCIQFLVRKPGPRTTDHFLSLSAQEGQ